jgi:hypothetical protein
LEPSGFSACSLWLPEAKAMGNTLNLESSDPIVSDDPLLKVRDEFKTLG